MHRAVSMVWWADETPTQSASRFRLWSAGKRLCPDAKCQLPDSGRNPFLHTELLTLPSMDGSHRVIGQVVTGRYQRPPCR
jgi:hypothetical protein